MGIFDSFKKSSKLSKISKVLGRGYADHELKKLVSNPSSLMDYLNEDPDKIKKEREEHDKALEELFDLIESNKDLKRIMDHHGADREKLKDLYKTLKREGICLWRRGHFVVASTLAFGQTLDYCLAAEKKGISYESISSRCLMYFKNNETGQIKF